MWFLALLICTLITAVAVFYIDVPIAHHVYGIFGPAKAWERDFRAPFFSEPRQQLRWGWLSFG
jgi:hypothetical protein